METVGKYLIDHPEFDIFSIEEKKRVFKEVGLHTVCFGESFGKEEYMVIQVHDCGGFTILEQHFS